MTELTPPSLSRCVAIALTLWTATPALADDELDALARDQVTTRVRAQLDPANATDFDTWARGFVLQRVTSEREHAAGRLDGSRAAIGGRSGSNQVEGATASTNTTTLVDSTGSSDFIGVALNLAGLSGGTDDASGSDTNGAIATVSGYALLAGVMGNTADRMLDSNLYCETGARRARMFSATIGYDDADKGSPDDRVIIYGAKLNIPLSKQRELCDVSQWEDVRSLLEKAAGEQSEFNVTLAAALIEAAAVEGDAVPDAERVRRKKIVEAFDDANPENTRQLFLLLGEQEVVRVVGESIAKHPELLVSQNEYDDLVATAIREYETRPRLAVEYLTRSRDGAGDVQTVKALLEFGRPLQRGTLNFNANLAWESTQASGEDQSGGTAAFALEWRGQDDLVGARPMRFAIGGDGKWVSNAEDQYRAQARLTVPIFAGVELPISVTWANRSELIDESEVRGQIGFTFDTAQILSLLR
jgi:hypothetical protein